MSNGAPTLRARESALARRSRTTPPPTVPQPNRPRRIGFIVGVYTRSRRADPSIRRQCSLRRLLVWLRLRHLLPTRLHHLIHLARQDELEIVLDLSRHLVEVGLVSFGHEDTLDPGT